MEKVIVIDGGGVQFRAIFNYIGQYKSKLDKIMYPYATAEAKGREVYCIEEATEILERKIANHEIFMCYPTLTYCRMVVGYLKKLEVTMEDTIICAQDFGSWRKKLDKSYKSTRREQKISVKPQEWWDEQYKEFNDLYKKLDMALPIHFIKIFNLESDDVGAYCCRYYKDKPVILISSDRDWEQLAIFLNTKIWSPISKKFKIIPSPLSILQEKINGDLVDGLLTKPSSEKEWEIRRKIVDLTQLPLEIERPIKEALDKIMPKSIYLHKIPYRSVREEISKLYKLEEK